MNNTSLSQHKLEILNIMKPNIDYIGQKKDHPEMDYAMAV